MFLQSQAKFEDSGALAMDKISSNIRLQHIVSGDHRLSKVNFEEFPVLTKSKPICFESISCQKPRETTFIPSKLSSIIAQASEFPDLVKKRKLKKKRSPLARSTNGLDELAHSPLFGQDVLCGEPVPPLDSRVPEMTTNPAVALFRSVEDEGFADGDDVNCALPRTSATKITARSRTRRKPVQKNDAILLPIGDVHQDESQREEHQLANSTGSLACQPQQRLSGAKPVDSLSSGPVESGRDTGYGSPTLPSWAMTTESRSAPVAMATMARKTSRPGEFATDEIGDTEPDEEEEDGGEEEEEELEGNDLLHLISNSLDRFNASLHPFQYRQHGKECPQPVAGSERCDDLNPTGSDDAALVVVPGKDLRHSANTDGKQAPRQPIPTNWWPPFEFGASASCPDQESFLPSLLRWDIALLPPSLQEQLQQRDSSGASKTDDLTSGVSVRHNSCSSSSSASLSASTFSSLSSTCSTPAVGDSNPAPGGCPRGHEGDDLVAGSPDNNNDASSQKLKFAFPALAACDGCRPTAEELRQRSVHFNEAHTCKLHQRQDCQMDSSTLQWPSATLNSNQTDVEPGMWRKPGHQCTCGAQTLTSATRQGDAEQSNTTESSGSLLSSLFDHPTADCNNSRCKMIDDLLLADTQSTNWLLSLMSNGHGESLDSRAQQLLLSMGLGLFPNGDLLPSRSDDLIGLLGLDSLNVQGHTDASNQKEPHSTAATNQHATCDFHARQLSQMSGDVIGESTMQFVPSAPTYSGGGCGESSLLKRLAKIGFKHNDFSSPHDDAPPNDTFSAGSHQNAESTDTARYKLPEYPFSGFAEHALIQSTHQERRGSVYPPRRRSGASNSFSSLPGDELGFGSGSGDSSVGWSVVRDVCAGEASTALQLPASVVDATGRVKHGGLSRLKTTTAPQHCDPTCARSSLGSFIRPSHRRAKQTTDTKHGSNPHSRNPGGSSSSSSNNTDAGGAGKPVVAKWRRACSFYLRGHCKKEDCEFAHDLTKVTCKFWEISECFKGSTCPFLHGYPSELEPVE